MYTQQFKSMYTLTIKLSSNSKVLRAVNPSSCQLINCQSVPVPYPAPKSLTKVNEITNKSNHYKPAMLRRVAALQLNCASTCFLSMEPVFSSLRLSIECRPTQVHTYIYASAPVYVYERLELAVKLLVRAGLGRRSQLGSGPVRETISYEVIKATSINHTLKSSLSSSNV